MNERKELEKELEMFISNIESIEKRLEVLKDAWWQSHNSGYCDAMANREMGGEESPQTLYWDACCKNKESIARLIAIYEEITNS